MRTVDRLLGLWKHVQLQHDVPAAASSLASAPSGVDMLDCKLNADENRRLEIGQNIPKKTVLFIFIHFHSLHSYTTIFRLFRRGWTFTTPSLHLGGLGVHVCSHGESVEGRSAPSCWGRRDDFNMMAKFDNFGPRNILGCEPWPKTCAECEASTLRNGSQPCYSMEKVSPESMSVGSHEKILKKSQF